MGHHRALCDGQTEPETTGSLPIQTPIERLEDRLEIGFGHAGAGGSHAFADPVCGLSFGYAMNRMDLNVLPGVKTRNLISAVMKEMEERLEA